MGGIRWNRSKARTFGVVGVLCILAFGAVFYATTERPGGRAEGTLPVSAVPSASTTELARPSLPSHEHTATTLAQTPHSSPDARMEYAAFVRKLGQIIRGQDAAYQQLYNSLRDPASYVQRLQALHRFQFESTEFGTNWSKRDYQPVKLRIGRYAPSTGTEFVDQTHFPVLPAALGVELALPSHRYLEHVIVRWIDTENGQVVGLEFIEFDGLAGSQRFTARPAPDVEAGSYRLEVYDAGEGLEYVAAMSVAIGETNALADRRNVEPGF